VVDAVTYILNNDATVQGLVGLNKEEDKYKIYPVVVPQSETAPYISARLSSKEPQGKESGCGYLFTVTVSSYANSYDDVQALNVAVIAALLNQANGTVNGVDFGGLFFVNESDDYLREHNLFIKLTTFGGTA
jgi:hypothetical protein